jgi:hypothetical protein
MLSNNFVAFGNAELDAAPTIAAGDEYDCPRCHKKHIVQDSKPPMICFVACRGKTYLVGVKGKAVSFTNKEKL